jgi:hypothetical protein
MKLLLAVLLIIHGLIVAAQAGGSFNPGPGIANPSWLPWWPTALGQSWLLSRPGLVGSPLVGVGGLLWLAAGVALVAAGLGILGVVVPPVWWRPLAVAGAALSLFMLFVYLHPFYTLGIGADVVLLVALLWLHWPRPEVIGV